MPVDTLTASELKTRLEQGDELLMLDVREPHEYDYAHIAGSILIPLQLIPLRLGEIDPERHVVAICHHGIRSMQAARYLAYSGFTRVSNLSGGIDAWSVNCDSTVPRY